MRHKQNLIPAPVDRKTLKVLYEVTTVTVVCVSVLGSTSFESGYPTVEELVCSVVSDEIICNSCAICISHTYFTWLGGWFYVKVYVQHNSQKAIVSLKECRSSWKMS
jgi:hypothetical protein